MWAEVSSIGLKGMEGYRLRVEVSTCVGADSFKIVGLPDAAVKEAKERIRAALGSLGYVISGQRIIINLSPPDQKKMGSLFDLSMAIALLISLHELEGAVAEDTGFIGALSLDGSLQPVEGMLAAVLAAKKVGLKRLYLPFDEKLPPLDVVGVELIFAHSLQDVLGHLSGQWIPPHFLKPKAVEQMDERGDYPDFQQIIGHSYAKFALEVAAAGGHHLLMIGPPGCGKSLLAWSLPTILPALTRKAQLEVMSLYQLAHISYLSTAVPPFRNPHHSASGVSIIGGGQYPKPGEISLAHHGVLFLDEIGEFSKKTLDMLRQPLENGDITISRTHATITYPASFIMLAAMNPCPCGYAGSNSHYCTCSARQVLAYQNRISGPLRDRFDIQLSLKSVDLGIAGGDGGRLEESSKMVRKRVEAARQRQYERFGREITNGRVPYDELIKASPLTPKQQSMIQQLLYQKDWSNRTQIKIIRLARTISDLSDERGSQISDESISEAIKLNSVSNSVSGTARGQNH